MGWEIGMDPDATEQALARVQALEEDTGTVWRRLRGEVAGQEEGIGHGRLAQAFRPTYTPLADPARVLADSALAQLEASLHGGRVSVQRYREADQAAAGGFPRPR
ncbi:hypothetical protein [Saccharothrix variisporea]|uniref:Excreted virulence factor EspC (Type VII ESX diderm) n=1 Tax=Saccharothrix variisporea TaxID=543527 RepID=A0A495X4R8_9PSEU|nr:hypothetical protein [Saccharothrix variisporea]RKT69291.1 hypothetical protein DFJ66_2496 [Saccharothrix variisporea]